MKTFIAIVLFIVLMIAGVYMKEDECNEKCGNNNWIATKEDCICG